MEERLEINDNIKTAMMLAVVLYHSCMFFTGTWFDKAQPVYKANYIGYFAKYLNTFHVRTFVMTAGFLFYALRKEKKKYRNNLKKDAFKRAKRLLLPYVCTIVFWVLPFYIVYSGFDITKIIYKYIFGCAPSQLWFLPMLFWLFTVYYIVFEKHTPSKAGFVINTLISIGGGYVVNKLGLINFLQFVTAVHYAMFYYMGAYLYEHGIKLPVKKVAFSFGISFGCYILSQVILDKESVALKVMLLVSDNIGLLAGVLAVYGMANLVHKRNDFVGMLLKKNSFGIYLFHQQLIYPCIMLLNGKVHPAVQVIVCFIAAICGATVITEFLRKFKVTKVMFGI